MLYIERFNGSTLVKGVLYIRVCRAVLYMHGSLGGGGGVHPWVGGMCMGGGGGGVRAWVLEGWWCVHGS